MTDWLKKYHKAFGDKRPPVESLWDFDLRLRFELGGEVWGTDKPIRRFLQAHSRACAVTEFIFENSAQIHAMILSFGDSNGINTEFSRLIPVLPNITRQNFDFEGSGQGRDDDPEGRDFWHVAPITDPIQIKELLWLDMAREMGITPSASHLTFFVDFNQSILVHAYDDRGMDVVAIEKSRLKPTYDKFNDWLLDYDRPRITPLFEET